MATETATKTESATSDDLAWPVVITLKHPITFGSQTIATIEMRRGVLGDIKGVVLGEAPPADRLFLVASRLSGQPIKVIEMLDADDAGEVMQVVMSFFGKCLTTGSARSL